MEKSPKKKDIENVALEFDGVASVYEENRLANWYKAQAECVMDVLDYRSDALLLDIGCGTGWFLRKTLEERSEWFGLGIDVSSKMLRCAQDLAGRLRNFDTGRLRFVQGDWESLDTQQIIAAHGKCPNMAVCISSFHYFSNPEASLRKVHSVLAPDGEILIMDRAKDGSYLTKLWDLIHRFFINDHVKYFDTDEIKALLFNAGFKNIMVLKHINKFFWNQKVYTSLVLIRAEKTSDRIHD